MAVTSETGSANIEDNPGNGEKEETAAIPDPLESFNRAMFVFNDKLYFWVLKPVAQGYKKVVPEAPRVGVKNFFSQSEIPGPFCQLPAPGRLQRGGRGIWPFRGKHHLGSRGTIGSGIEQTTEYPEK